MVLHSRGHRPRADEGNERALRPWNTPYARMGFGAERCGILRLLTFSVCNLATSGDDTSKRDLVDIDILSDVEPAAGIPIYGVPDLEQSEGAQEAGHKVRGVPALSQPRSSSF